MKLIAEPYTLELRHDIKVTEQDLRRNLNLDWCDGLLFNVTVIENKPLAEYDVILWDEKEKMILFIEYKDSINAYQNLKEYETNQKKDYALNISRAFGFLKYDFIVVVKGLEEGIKKSKGKAKVIALTEFNDYLLKMDSFESTLLELDYVKWLLNKYDRKENIVDLKKEQIIKELTNLKSMIEQVNK